MSTRACVFALLAACSSSGARGPFEEARLLSWPADVELGDGDISRDGMLAEFVFRTDAGDRIVFSNGVRGPVHAHIRGNALSPDRATVRCLFRDDGDVEERVEWISAADGRVLPLNDPEPVAEPGIEWRSTEQPDGGYTSRVAVDGKWSEDFDDIETPVIRSPDGEHFAYPASRGRKMSLVVDHAWSVEYDEVRDPLFDPAGRLVYTARRGDRWVVVWGGRELDEFDQIAHDAPERMYAFSPDGSVIAYMAREAGGDHVLVVGEQRWRELGTMPVFPAFSSDGKKVRFTALNRDKREIWRRVIDVE